jgi:imidazolonepropionase-like amidohydrolase
MLARTLRALTALALCILIAALPASAQEQAHAFRGATLYPISSPPVENGLLVVQNGEIVYAGADDASRIPSDALVHDASGQVIMPGLVDTHSHIAEVSGGDRSSALNPDVRTLDAVNARSKSISRARAGGITSVNVMSGSGHLMSGQTTYLKLRDGRTIYDLLFCDDILTEICGGMKMANGTNSIRSGPFPGTRAKSAAMQRALFIEAQEFCAEDAEERGRDLRMEPMCEILDGRRTVHFHTHRHDDILTTLRLKEEFGFDLVLHHVSEGWKVGEEVAAAGVPASIIVIDSPGGKLEAMDLRLETGAMMHEDGVRISIHTDDLITDSRVFLRSAGLAVRAGMPVDAALEALTLEGARQMRIDDRVGSLEAGKDADFIVLSGNPLSVYTHVMQTWVEGQKLFDREDPEDYKLAVGGYGVYNADEHNDHIHR